jgi:AGZA family xanthine/uracil permease-like MFS transporter
MTMQSTMDTRPRWWVPGDWNGFFGLFTNVLLNVIVLTTLCLFVVNLPGDVVYGRILPALGIALPIGNLYYAYLAWRLARQEGRNDVTAMPYGPSVPHMFIVVFVIMLPIYLQNSAAMGEAEAALLAWRAGLAWAFIIGIIVLIGVFVGPAIRRLTPRAAMLGTLAGISIAFIAMRPAFQMWEVPWIAFVSLGIVLISWTANVRLPGGVPGGLAAVIVGAAIGWAAYALGWTAIVDADRVAASLDQFGLYLPIPGGEVFEALTSDQIWLLLATAIPLGIYNFTEAMNNVESASAAGDNYDLRHILAADGLGAVVGSILGSPFPPAVYIGHPGWKAVGGRIGYSLATGIIIALVCFLGLTALLLEVIPLVAILPILLYIGLVIGAQAFTASPGRHAAAVVLAIIPNIAAWGKTQVDGSLAAAGTDAATLGAQTLGNAGLVYQGMALLAGGAVLAGLVLGSIAVFIIDRDFTKAAIYSAVGAVLSFFGLIHAERLDLWPDQFPQVALGYALLAVICYVVGMREQSVGTARGPGMADVAEERLP